MMTERERFRWLLSVSGSIKDGSGAQQTRETIYPDQ
jgi:hypothetical protein